jgi:hypothetical protein
MSDRLAILSASINALRRPQLLIRAARFGLAEYRRDRDLRRLLAVAPLPSPAAAVGQLLEAEAEAEACRREGAATYSVARHIEILVALIAEARLMLHPHADAAS